MSVEVLVPWRGGCEHREAAFEWVLGRFGALDFEVTVGTLPPWAPWVKARAVMPLIERSEAEIVIVSDADVWCGAKALRLAIDAVRNGASWAVPHRHVHRLTPEATETVVGGSHILRGLPCEVHPYLGVEGGGILIGRREVLLDVPLDPRFEGWGREDVCWGIALRALAGTPFKGRVPLYHLWHPPQPCEVFGFGSPESEALWRRYVNAKKPGGGGGVRAVIEEVRVGQAQAA